MTGASLTAEALCCVCGEANLALVHEYTQPPEGETRYRFAANRAYRRELLRCDTCGHFVSVYDLGDADLYRGDYVDSTYGADGIRRSFERIIGLDPARSDNAARVRWIRQLAQSHFGDRDDRASHTLLDIGSGLGVFPFAMKEAGWLCTALDPDERSVAHARTVIGIDAICADFMEVEDLGVFEVITLNKVIEHVPDPIAMLARTGRFLSDGGFVYVEVPDGPAAFADSPQREEFYIDHLHAFSFASLSVTARAAGFAPIVMQRTREPSSKYTIRAALQPQGAAPAESGGRSTRPHDDR